MGKGQSKHGHCYVVNAHFNPLCQLEENNSCHSIETPLASQDSGLQLTPELSFTLSEDNKSGSEKNLMTKCALQVFLPQDNVIKAEKEADMDVNPEKADEEKSEKAEKQMMVECVSVNDVEKQEFSFVLYNFNGEETEKEDVEKMVVRSICDALKSSLKLPPSGTHTLKVHLTVSPDGNTKLSPQNQTCNDEFSRTADKESSHEQVKLLHNSKTGCNQKKNVDFVLPTHTSPAKHSETYPKCCSQDSDFPKLVQCPTTDIKQSALPSPCMKRNCHSVQKQETQKWTDTNETSQDSADLNGLFSTPNLDLRERRHRNHHNRHQNHRDRSHYQEFLGSEGVSDMKQNCNKPNISDPRHTDPSYCAAHLMDKGSTCYSRQNHDFPDYRNHKKSGLNFQKLQDPELHSHILKCKLLREAKSNMLDLSFDLCDLNGKTDTEPNHHRRSKSYDMNESQSNCCMLNSPKVRHRDCVESNYSAAHYPHSYIPQSPSRHHRHRHREREKNRQRAMQQVASWLEKEHLGNAEQKQQSPDSSLHNQNGSVIERHEYHHIHEHHHYYHYVDS